MNLIETKPFPIRGAIALANELFDGHLTQEDHRYIHYGSQAPAREEPFLLSYQKVAQDRRNSLVLVALMQDALAELKFEAKGISSSDISIVERMFGLDGQEPAQSLAEIGRSLGHNNREWARGRAHKTIKRLRHPRYVYRLQAYIRETFEPNQTIPPVGEQGLKP